MNKRTRRDKRIQYGYFEYPKRVYIGLELGFVKETGGITIIEKLKLQDEEIKKLKAILAEVVDKVYSE